MPVLDMNRKYEYVKTYASPERGFPWFVKRASGYEKARSTGWLCNKTAATVDKPRHHVHYVV